MAETFAFDIASFFIGVGVMIFINQVKARSDGKIADMLVGPKYPNLEGLEKKGVVVVTGASTGIGYDAAIHLAERGFHVFACVRKEADFNKIEELRASRQGQLQEEQQEILSTDSNTSQNGKNSKNSKNKANPSDFNLYPIYLDVTKKDHIESAYEQVKGVCTSLSLPFAGLVNNAGVALANALEFTDEADVRWMMEANYFGVVNLTQRFLPLIRQDKSRIVIVGSIAGVIPTPGCGHYSASKYAIRGYADNLRLEMSWFGVSVSLLEPGYIQTKIIDKTFDNLDENINQDNEMMNVYGKHLFSKATLKIKHGDSSSAVSTEVSSTAIYHALTASRPKTRYPVANVFKGKTAEDLVKTLRTVASQRLLDFFILQRFPADPVEKAGKGKKGEKTTATATATSKSDDNLELEVIDKQSEMKVEAEHIA